MISSHSHPSLCPGRNRSPEQVSDLSKVTQQGNGQAGARTPVSYLQPRSSQTGHPWNTLPRVSCLKHHMVRSRPVYREKLKVKGKHFLDFCV